MAPNFSMKLACEKDFVIFSLYFYKNYAIKNGNAMALTFSFNLRFGVVVTTKLVFLFRFKNFCLICIFPLFLWSTFLNYLSLLKTKVYEYSSISSRFFKKYLVSVTVRSSLSYF